jgi:hypothetical protein
LNEERDRVRWRNRQGHGETRMRQLGPRVSTIDGSADQVAVSTDADTMKNRIDRAGVARVCQQPAASPNGVVARFVYELPVTACVCRTPNPILPEQAA